MFLFLIILFISFLIAIIVYKLGNKDVTAAILIFIIMIMALCLLGGAISSSYINLHQNDFKWEMTLDTTFYIKTLNDKAGVMSGSFILGSGRILTQSYYFFYIQDNDSTFYLNEIPTSNCKIRESDITNAYVKKFNFTLAPGQNDWLLVGLSQRTFYFIYVPKNTIIVNYNLNGQ